MLTTFVEVLQLLLLHCAVPYGAVCQILNFVLQVWCGCAGPGRVLLQLARQAVQLFVCTAMWQALSVT